MSFLVPAAVQPLFQAASLLFKNKASNHSEQYHRKKSVANAIKSLFRMAVAYGGYRAFEKALGSVSLSSAWNHKLATALIGSGQWILLSGPSLLITTGAAAIRNAIPELSRAFASRTFSHQTGHAALGVVLGIFLLSSFAHKTLGCYKFEDGERFTGFADILARFKLAKKVAEYFYPKKS